MTRGSASTPLLRHREENASMIRNVSLSYKIKVLPATVKPFKELREGTVVNKLEECGENWKTTQCIDSERETGAEQSS